MELNEAQNTESTRYYGVRHNTESTGYYEVKSDIDTESRGVGKEEQQPLLLK